MEGSMQANRKCSICEQLHTQTASFPLRNKLVCGIIKTQLCSFTKTNVFPTFPDIIRFHKTNIYLKNSTH